MVRDKRETETSFLTKILEILAPPVLNERGRKEELVYSISAAAAHCVFPSPPRLNANLFTHTSGL